MNAACYKHPKAEAVTRCAACEKPLCTKCMTKFQGEYVCGKACAKRLGALADHMRKHLAGETLKRPVWVRMLRAVILGSIAVAILEWLDIIDFVPWI